MPKPCKSSTRVCRVLFFTGKVAQVVQQYELNRSRPEARCLISFAASAQQVCFPAVAQAARLTRLVDRQPKPGARASKAVRIQTEWLLSSRSPAALPVEAMLTADRHYWGIENGLHLRLDVSGGEDRSRVRHRTAAFNLAMIRRATISVAIHWIHHCRKPRQATLQGFYDFMRAKHAQRAFSLVTASKTSWLP